ncbi:MAG TPA: response regulator [Candidatus Sulfotelmatobacter sp.]|nr:response regulator [Candidatus Sulfotelmatobacter sp.]
MDRSSRGVPAYIVATVTYSDPDWHVLFVADDQRGMYISVPGAFSAKAADLVRIDGQIGTPDVGIANPRIAVISHNNPLPLAPHAADIAELTSLIAQPVAVNGIVRWSGVHNGRAAIQLYSNEQKAWVYFSAANADEMPSSGSQVAVTGVAAAEIDGDGAMRGAQIFSPSIRDLTVERRNPEDPFSLPISTVSQLRRLRQGTLVRLAGSVEQNDQAFELADASGAVPVSFQYSPDSGAPSAEVVGFWNGYSLEDALFRARPQSLKADGESITRLWDLKHLSSSVAAAHRPVSVRATVTYFDQDWHLLFVQDKTAGAFVVPGHLDYVLVPGDIVQISGVSSAGDFAPIVDRAKIAFIGKGQLPAAPQIDVLQANIADVDAQWSSFRAVVHSVLHHDGRTGIRVGVGHHDLTLQFPGSFDLDSLVDKEVLVQGVFAALLNERRQLIGRQVFVPSPEFVQVTATPPSAEIRTIASIGHYKPGSDERHSTILQGTVVLKDAADSIFIQDGTGGIQVIGVTPFDVKDGDLVRARGFVTEQDFSAVLEEAVVTRESSGKLPQPKAVSAASASKGEYDSDFVSLQGTVKGVQPEAKRTVLELEADGARFEAIGPPGKRLNSLRPESTVEVRGVCRRALDYRHVPFTATEFSISFDSPDSLTVLKGGPWLDGERVRWLLVALLCLAGVVSLWAILLRIQVRRRTRELQQVREELLHSARLEAVGKLAGGIAHDFNNLVMIIKGYSELLMDSAGPETEPHLKEIQRAADRASELTRQLLAFSRKQMLCPQVLDPNQCVRNIAKMLRVLIGEDIEIVTSLSDKVGRIRADLGQVEQLLVNLALNARDAMPGGGRLFIETQPAYLDKSYAATHPEVTPGPFAMIAVTDTGCGMSKETLAHIFEPFFTTKQMGKGTGLGLATAYGIIKQSRGHISAYSEVGAGTTFKIYLPSVVAPATAVLEQTTGPAPTGEGTVLVAEDEPPLRDLVAGVLKKAGYRVLEAGDGVEALTVTEQEEEIDLVVTDVVMPRMGGPELVQKLRDKRPDLPVIFMSGYTKGAALENVNLGSNTFLLSKPFTMEALAHKVKEVRQTSACELSTP